MVESTKKSSKILPDSYHRFCLPDKQSSDSELKEKSLGKVVIAKANYNVKEDIFYKDGYNYVSGIFDKDPRNGIYYVKGNLGINGEKKKVAKKLLNDLDEIFVSEYSPKNTPDIGQYEKFIFPSSEKKNDFLEDLERKTVLGKVKHYSDIFMEGVLESNGYNDEGSKKDFSISQGDYSKALDTTISDFLLVKREFFDG